MSHRNLNLHQRIIDSNDIADELITFWEELDNDFAENDEGDPTAQDIVLELWENWDDADIPFVHVVLDRIKEGHGSFSSQFQYCVDEDENHNIIISLAFLS